MTERDASIAARVPANLRADLEALAKRDSVELSIVVRRLLREGADRELAGDTERLGLFAVQPQAGRRRRPSSATEVEARLKAAPRAGTGRFKALAEFELAGARGLTADDAWRKIGGPQNSVAKRVSELAAGGHIEPLRLVGATFGPGARASGQAARALAAGERAMDDGLVARVTTADAWATVYVITAAGHRALEDARRHVRQEAA